MPLPTHSSGSSRQTAIPAWYRHRVLHGSFWELVSAFPPYRALTRNRRRFWLAFAIYVAMLLIAFKPIAFGIVAIAERWSSPPPAWFRFLAGLTFVFLLFWPLSLLFWLFGLRRSMIRLGNRCLACGAPRSSDLAQRCMDCGADLTEQDGYRRLLAEPSGVGDSTAARYRALRKRTPAGLALRIAATLLFAASTLCVVEMVRHERANPPRRLPDGKLDRSAYEKGVLLTGCALLCAGALSLFQARVRDARANLIALHGSCFMCGRPIKPDLCECPNCSAWLAPQRLYSDWLQARIAERMPE